MTSCEAKEEKLLAVDEAIGAGAPGRVSVLEVALCAVSTSFLTILPSGPEPAMLFKSTPLSAAIFLAKGLALIRPSPTDGASMAVGAATASSAFVTLSSSATGAESVAAELESLSNKEEISSPASPMIAISPPNGTASPSPGTIFKIVPASNTSTSIVALSVSTSAMISPADTESPSLTFHLAITPSSMVSLSLGISILMAIA